MTLAIKRLKNIGWLALVFLVSIMLYPLSLNVAAVHSDLMRVDRKIRETKREISYLQAELRTRASPQQLEEWNDLLYGYKPPTAQQFLEGEDALAGLNGNAPTIKPVMVAAAEYGDGAAPAGVIGSPFAPIEPTDAASAPADAKRDTQTTHLEPDAAGERDKADGGAGTVQPISNRTIKLAAMDKKILSDDLLKDIERRAARERKAR